MPFFLAIIGVLYACFFKDCGHSRCLEQSNLSIKSPSLVEAAPRGQAQQVAVHQAGVGLPAGNPPAGLKADSQLEATTLRARPVEPDQLDLVVDLHFSFVKLTLQQALDTLGRKHRLHL